MGRYFLKVRKISVAKDDDVGKALGNHIVLKNDSNIPYQDDVFHPNVRIIVIISVIYVRAKVEDPVPGNIIVIDDYARDVDPVDGVDANGLAPDN